MTTVSTEGLGSLLFTDSVMTQKFTGLSSVESREISLFIQKNFKLLSEYPSPICRHTKTLDKGSLISPHRSLLIQRSKGRQIEEIYVLLKTKGGVNSVSEVHKGREVIAVAKYAIGFFSGELHVQKSKEESLEERMKLVMKSLRYYSRIASEPGVAQLRHVCKYLSKSGAKKISRMQAYYNEKSLHHFMCRMSSEKLSLEQRKRLVYHVSREAIRGLASIHNKGLIHCDVKPDNFLVHIGKEAKKKSEKEVKLKQESEDYSGVRIEISDFESLVSLGDRWEGNTFTPIYLAPNRPLEFLCWTGEFQKHDVWSLGITLMEFKVGILGGVNREVFLKELNEILKDARTGISDVSEKFTKIFKAKYIPYRNSLGTLDYLIDSMLSWKVDSRISAESALRYLEEIGYEALLTDEPVRPASHSEARARTDWVPYLYNNGTYYAVKIGMQIGRVVKTFPEYLPSIKGYK